MPPVLPIEYDGVFRLDRDVAREIGKKYKEKYVNARPFPHIYIDEIIPRKIMERIYEEFPEEKKDSDLNFEGGYSGLHKRLIQPSQCSPFTQSFFSFLNSEPILVFLENMTGIIGLIPDPYFNGGGLHEIATGGLLGVHVDFRLHEQLRLERRMNLLIYLNPGWQIEWGGQLGLWDERVKNEIQKIDPLFNRCAVFNTDAKSYHGHPDPLACPDNRRRRSIAMYYYTASDSIFDEVQGNSTIYVPRENEAFSDRLQAWKVRMYSISKDLMPPIAFRALRRAMGGKEFNR